MKTMSKMTLVRLLAGKNMSEVAREDGVSPQAIRFRLTPDDLTTYQNHSAQLSADRQQADADDMEERRAWRWGSKPEARFWESVDIQGPDDCWEWQGSRLPSGYGQLHIWGDKNHLYAHRVTWEIAHGPVPDDLDICHSCDNPPCCNPAHLWAGTAKQNTWDSIRKGRFFAWREKKSTCNIDEVC